MEEEEDRILFSSLGVTSAKAEDVERDILAEAEALTQVLCILMLCFLMCHCI